MAFRDVESPGPIDLATDVAQSRLDGPTLEDVYPKALDARARGQDYVFVETHAGGRQWVQSIVAFGCRGLVVRRIRERPKSGQVDAGPIVRLVVRFFVIDVLLAHKRWLIDRLTPRSDMPINRRRRRRPRNVMIR